MTALGAGVPRRTPAPPDSPTCRRPTRCRTSSGSAIALGDDRLSFVGYSYGTFLGASYADAYPDKVRAFVLDGPVDPTMDAAQVALGQARGFEHALDDFLADCSERTRDATFHHDGDAAGAYDDLRARAARAPLAASNADGRDLNQTRFDAAVLQELYLGRAAWPALADALARCRATVTRRRCCRSPIRSSGRDADGRDDHVLEAFWAVSCRDGPVIGDIAAAAALESRAIEMAPAPRRVHRQQQPAVLGVAGPAGCRAGAAHRRRRATHPRRRHLA